MPTQDTDKYWQVIGRENPYWGVNTQDRFHAKNLTSESIEELYASGEDQATFLFERIHQHIDPRFAPVSALDFGCGVGRVLVPLARRCRQVVGVDVSDGMLQRARMRCDAEGLTNVRFATADDRLSGITETFDLVHSFIVFQHIPSTRGYTITNRLLQLLNDGGVGVLHFVYFANVRSRYPRLRAVTQAFGLYSWLSSVRAVVQRSRARTMQMNCYDMNLILQALQAAGVRRLHAEYTDHDGFLGVVLFFKKESTQRPALAGPQRNSQSST